MEQFDFAHLKEQYGITGVVHVGAHHGDEGEEYLEAGLEQIYMIEAEPEAYEELRKKYLGTPVCTIQALVTDRDGGTTKFHKSNNEVSSSVFDFKDHISFHPTVQMVDVVTLPNNALDTIMLAMKADQVNCLVVDVQGAEKLVFAGGQQFLKQIDVVITEYSTVEMYDGGTTYEELEETLSDFVRILPMNLVHHGDALFVRRSAIEENEV